MTHKRMHSIGVMSVPGPVDKIDTKASAPRTRGVARTVDLRAKPTVPVLFFFILNEDWYLNEREMDFI